MQSKRVLIVTPGFLPLFGGMEEQCYVLAKAFKRLGYEVDILTEKTENSWLKEENIDGICVFRLPWVKTRNFLGLTKIFLALCMYLLKNNKKYDFCIIRTLTFPSVVVGLMKLLGLGLPTVVTAETGGDCDDIVALKKSRLWKLLVYLIERNDYLNAICEDNLSHYNDMGFKMNKVRNIYNGVETNDFINIDYPKEINNFVFLGRLVKTKGVFELIDAFKMLLNKYPKKKLYIGGDGIDKELLLKQIVGYETNIEYGGFITREKKKLFLLKADCLVLPSYSEGFPISILEAISLKRYIIATDVSDLKKLLGNNMLFCKKTDADDLYKKMIYMVSEFDKTVVKYDDVVELVDINNVAKRFIDLFSSEKNN